MEEETRKCLLAIRIRGLSDVSGEIQETLRMLHLTRNCNATLVDDRPSYRGMLKKAQHWVTWGEISKENISRLITKRGRLSGRRKLTDDYAQENGYKSVNDLAEAIHNASLEFFHLPQVQPVFRLHPPRKGFRGKVKRSYATGGVTGYRGKAINDLLKKMM